MYLKNVMSRFELHGRTAVVTGGAGLLGRQHVEALASAGANCILADINRNAVEKAVRELKASHPEVEITGSVTDITSKSQVEGLQEEAEREFGAIDILINNAAYNPKMMSSGDLKETSRVENFSLEQWNKEIEIGLTGAFICCQVIGSRMAERHRGVILNISSDLSVIAPDQRLYKKDILNEDSQPVKPITYSVIKTGLLGLTRYLATYWADKNVRVNALSPGGIYEGQPEEFVRRLSSLIPMGRMAKKDEYQAAVLFLVSDASSYMTGFNLVADGGRTVW